MRNDTNFRPLHAEIEPVPRSSTSCRQTTIRASRLVVTALAFVAAGLGLQSVAGADNPQRYPFDPACPWGRLADGHGMMIRCLKPNEASALLQADVQAQPVTAAAKGQASEGSKEKAPAPRPQPESPSNNQKVSVDSVGPAVADAGELPLAEKKLALPKDRYIQCVARHGGLTAKKAKVVVRFLVRERGRAEGVAVKSVTGMSQAAAQCIADVVDRRYVGYPAAPIVGATIPIVLSVTP